MRECYKKVAECIEKLQKERAETGEPQSPASFRALYAMRQSPDDASPQENGEGE